MLTVEQIREMNISMLGLGAPIEKDEKGYNKPDYVRMECIGMLSGIVDVTLEEIYFTLSVLKNYKNTQLNDYKDEIEETFAFYEAKFNEKYQGDQEYKRYMALDDAQYGRNHGYNDYNHLELIYSGQQEECALLRFREYISDVRLNDYNARWTKDSSGEFAMKVPFRKMDDFLKYVRCVGKFGYIAPQSLIDDLERFKTEQAEKEANKAERIIHFTALNQQNRYGYDLYSLDINDYDFNQELWDLKGRGLTYVDYKSDRNAVIISSNDDMLPELISFLKDKGVDVSAVENIERVDKNKSDNTLIDVSKLDLPFEPYPFQIEDANIVIGKKRAMLGHDMGCGKTFISALVGMSISEKKLVICPETLRLNWKRELERVHKGADIKIVYSKDKEPEFGNDWTIMGYKTAVKFKELIMENSFNCLFVDEAHKCKAVNNYGRPDSKQAAAVLSLSKNMEYTYLLTGTPMPTRNKDLYNELVMLGEINDTVKYAFHKFGTKYCDAHNNGYGWEYNGSSNAEELHDLLSRYMTRRRKVDVLPDLKKQRIPIIIDAKLSKEYLETEKRLSDMEDDDSFMALAMTGRRQLSQCKVDTAIEYAETLIEDGQAVVLVAEFDDTLDAMMKYFGDRACCIRGGMSDTAKQKAIDDFQSGEKQVCCINLIAGGVGVTLTEAHNMVICDFDWTPANMTQVEDRICRSGQTEMCNIFYICHEKSILDDVFMEMITNKSENIDLVVDSSENTVDLVQMRNKQGYGASEFLSRLKKRIKAKKKAEKAAEKKEKKKSGGKTGKKEQKKDTDKERKEPEPVEVDAESDFAFFAQVVGVDIDDFDDWDEEFDDDIDDYYRAGDAR